MTEPELVRRAARRTGVAAVAVGAAIVVMLTAGALVVLQRDQRAAASILLSDTVTRADDVEDPPSGMVLAIRDGTGTAVSPGAPAGLPVTDALDRVGRTGDVDLREVDLGSTRFRLRTQRTGRGVVQAALDLASDRVQSRSVLGALLLLGGTGLLMAAAAGAWLGRRAVRPLAAALALRRVFVADASHELRTPVTLLSTRAQLVRRSLRGRDAPDGLVREIDGLVADAAQLTSILEELLLAAEGEPVPAAPVDVGRVVDQVGEACAGHARERGIEVTVHAEPSSVVIGSSVALRRATTALVDNAVRHARRQVRIEVRRVGDTVRVRVGDDGPGFDPAVGERLFDRFASAPARAADGADPLGATAGADGEQPRYGLGLALVREVLTRHRGTAEWVDAPGPGAVVELRLPAAPGDGSGCRAARSATEPSR